MVGLGLFFAGTDASAADRGFDYALAAVFALLFLRGTLKELLVPKQAERGDEPAGVAPSAPSVDR